jgi:HEAT repeat protein
MTEDTSPENLRTFLESDDPAMVQMGLSMAKGAGVEITVKDLEHFLKSEDVEKIKTGVMLADEAGIGDEAMDMLCCRLVPDFDEIADIIWEERGEDIENNLWMLGQIGDKRAVSSLGDILESTDAQEQGWLDSAVWALGEIGDENVCLPLTDLFLRTIRDPVHGHEKSLREDIRFILSNYVPFLIEMLEEYLDVSVVLALGEIGNALAVEPLIKVLNSDGTVAGDKYVREEAARALGEIGDERAVEPLIKALGDEDDYVREATKEALKKLGHEVE